MKAIRKAYFAEVIAHQQALYSKKDPNSVRKEPGFDLKSRSRQPISMSAALRQNPTQPAVIAEHKRAAPSQGNYCCPYALEDVVEGYERAGATAISVLTQPLGFGGSLEDLQKARAATTLPVLRKEFIVHPLQLEEALVYGADAILLIAAALPFDEIRSLRERAGDLGLEVLLELHDASEIDYLRIEPEMVGINNRNLKTLEIDLEQSFKMLPQLPESITKVSESGIEHAKQAMELHKAGFDALLIGTEFMKSGEPEARLAMFVLQLKH